MWRRERPICDRKHAVRRRRSRRAGLRHGRFERLEDRTLLSGVPSGAAPDDTAEYMLGDVCVSVVLMESDASLAPYDASTENWTPQLIQATKDKIEAGLAWWQEMLAGTSSVHADDLHFVLDYTYADNPVHTGYEPIARISNAFQYWTYDFLRQVGFGDHWNGQLEFEQDIRAFNHAQRVAHGTDWAFTIFVVNSTIDYDDSFVAGGAYSMAFSFAGGQAMIVPSGRPASTYAHETGHMFWALDEYGSADYTRRRGYYNTQNLNAPHAGYTQQPSIMSGYALLDTAWASHVNAASTLAMLGWQDADGDGIFDVLDVPLALQGIGYYDTVAGVYRFRGSTAVNTLPNLNSAGLQNDITLNEISRAQYRVDGGPWQTAAEYHTRGADLDLTIPLPASGWQTLEIRTIDDDTGVTSPAFQGSPVGHAAVACPGINGFVWYDADADGQFEDVERGLAGWTIRVVDADGQPVTLGGTVEPDTFALGTLLTSISATPELSVTLSAVQNYLGTAVTVASNGAAAARHVFAGQSSDGWSTAWRTDATGVDSRRLRMDFSTPVSRVALDAIGTSAGSYGRLEVYDTSGRLLARYTTDALAAGQSETMLLERPIADIGYAIAYGHQGTAVQLDNLRFGPQTVAVSDTRGVYQLPGLPSGDYRLQALTPSGEIATTTGQPVSVAEGEAVEQINFPSAAAVASWRNPDNPLDVVPDGLLTPLDVLTVINYVNEHGSSAAVPSAPTLPPPYYDVDGNGLVTALDVLLVINAINGQPAINATVTPVSPPLASGSGESELVAIRQESRRTSGASPTLAPVVAADDDSGRIAAWTPPAPSTTARPGTAVPFAPTAALALDPSRVDAYFLNQTRDASVEDTERRWDKPRSVALPALDLLADLAEPLAAALVQA